MNIPIIFLIIIMCLRVRPLQILRASVRTATISLIYKVIQSVKLLLWRASFIQRSFSN